jgi:hypothetical protein
MNKIFTIIALICLSVAASAQTVGNVKGKLVDSLSKQSLKDASVTILDARVMRPFHANSIFQRQMPRLTWVPSTLNWLLMILVM